MAPILSSRLAIALSLMGFCSQGTAQAAGLADVVRQADAKYLEAPDLEWVNNAPNIEAGSGGEDTAPKPQEISQGPVRAVLSYREDRIEDSEVVYIPIFTVLVDGEQVAELEGEDGGFPDPPVDVQIAEIDPGKSYPEVVVSFYTGGAHCCSDTSVITASADGASWNTVAIGQFDGGPMLATDLDGDGSYELATSDNTFLYAFACYACSEAPLQVIAVENGAVTNVTSEPRFQRAHASWLKEMIGNLPEKWGRRERLPGRLCGREGPCSAK